MQRALSWSLRYTSHFTFLEYYIYYITYLESRYVGTLGQKKQMTMPSLDSLNPTNAGLFKPEFYLSYRKYSIGSQIQFWGLRGF